jgi:hypothetical protein
MGQYFQGWRRKIGVASLATACVFMVGWIRSFGVDDYLNAWAGRQSVGLKHYYNLWSLVSADGTLFLGRIWYQSPDAAEIDDGERDYRYPQWSVSYDSEFPNGDLRFIWHLCGFGVYERCPNDPNNGGLRLLIPYWSIVIPLTLLSAYLLLSKPRQSIQQKPAEPITEKRT